MKDDTEETLPTGLWSDEPEMESDLHLLQIMLLLQCLKGLWRERNDFYVAGNMTLFYSPEMVKNRDFRGPDFLVVKDVENRPRRSWTIWEEGGKVPNLIIEILSDSTANTDCTTKKDLYAGLGIE
jgi:Uma2 family endonuclease